MQSIVGNTIEYDIDDDSHMVEYTRANGSFVSMNVATKEKYRGSWKIESDRICYDYYTEFASDDVCARVYKSSDTEFSFYLTGGRPFGGKVTLQAGNPYGL